MPLVCHILIGCPGSGKSTIAAQIANHDSNYRIVSTDKIREKLFGDESIQGDWQLIETEIFSQIQQHLKAGNPIIYDATNARRPWRIALLRKLSKYQEVEWIGWYLETPLDVCKAWNRQRERQVPERVISKMHKSLKKFPPQAAEGFTAVYSVPYSQGKLDATQVKIKMAKLRIYRILKLDFWISAIALLHSIPRAIASFFLKGLLLRNPPL